MLMLSHASEVSRDELYNVITPEPTQSWKPVPHIEVVNTLTDRAAARGLVVKNERFALLDGTLYGTNGVQTRLPGARLFGSLDFAPIPGMPFPAGCAPSCGLRNSADKSFALSILSGARRQERLGIVPSEHGDHERAVAGTAGGRLQGTEPGADGGV